MTDIKRTADSYVESVRDFNRSYGGPLVLPEAIAMRLRKRGVDVDLLVSEGSAVIAARIPQTMVEGIDEDTPIVAHHIYLEDGEVKAEPIWADEFYRKA